MADRSATRLSDWPAGPHPSCNGRFVVSRRRYSLPLSLSLSFSPSPSLSFSLSLSLTLPPPQPLSLFRIRGCTLQPRSFNNPVNRDSTTVPTYLPAYPFPSSLFLLFFSPFSQFFSISLVVSRSFSVHLIDASSSLLPSRRRFFPTSAPLSPVCDSFVARTTTVQLSLELYQNIQGINVTFVGHSLILNTKV